MQTPYLPLTEYSSKYKVSISTLRRKIKAEDIRFVFEDGKYLIEDGPLSTHQKVHRPSLSQSDDSLVSAQSLSAPEPVLNVAHQLLAELKKAYSQILHEKEEQILQFKEEMSDLRTLVRVLESENERLSERINQHLSGNKRSL